jgi:ribonuclease HI
MEEGVGCAFVVYKENMEIKHQNYRLPSFCSVFQAELFALKSALEYLLGLSPSEPVAIYTDSYSSIQAIEDRSSKTPLVIAIQRLLLQHRQRGTNLLVQWVKAHVGIDGNERADSLAKDFLSSTAIPVAIDAPLSFVKRMLSHTAVTNWSRDWQSQTKGRWTAKFFPTVIQRKQAGKFEHNFVATQFLTSHGKFGTYLFERRCRDGPECVCGELQTCRHLLLECPLLIAARQDLETELSIRGYGLTINNLSIIFTEPELRSVANNTFHRIHRKLMAWEASGLLH